MSGHGRVVCECGKVLMQCRCACSGKNEIVESPCECPEEEEDETP